MLPLSLNTATVRDQWTLAQAIDGCARHGVRAIGPWRDKVAEMGLMPAARAIRDAGLAVSGLCRGGMFPANDQAGRDAAIEDNRRAIAEAHALGAACLVMVCGGLPPGSKDLPGARAMVADGLAAILPEARAAGITLALEPLHPMTCADRSVLSTLGQALDLCDALGEGTGVAVDVYHVWWDPDLPRQMERARGRIAAFHVCDWKVPTIDLVFDRGMPGEGVIDIPAIRAMAQDAGFAGAVECEVLSRAWWARDADDTMRAVVESYRQFC
jgi:sugar phosphate isomerase/epimerase